MEDLNTATIESTTVDVSKTPIYDFLKKNKLTTKDESSFVKEYSNPEKAKELHKFFSDNELTTKDFDSFYTDNFGSEKKNSGQNQDSSTGGQDSRVGLPPSQITKPNDLLNQSGSFTIQPTELIKKKQPARKIDFDKAVKSFEDSFSEKKRREVTNASPQRAVEEAELYNEGKAYRKSLADEAIKRQESDWKAKYGDGFSNGMGLGITYGFSKILSGASNIVPALVYASDRINKALTGQPLLSDEEKNYLIDSTKEAARLGLNEDYQGSDKAMTAVGGLLEFAPAAIAAESTGGISFYLNGVGNAYKEVQQLKKEGASFDRGAEDLFIQGKGITDYVLMTKLNAHSLFPTLPSGLRNVASREASIDAIKTLTKSGEPLTSESLVAAFKDSAVKMSDNIKNKGVPFLKDLAKGYAKTSGDLTALTLSDALLKKASNKLAGEENFQIPDGSVGENIANILTVDAPLFAAVGARNNLGVMFDKSPFKNEVVEAVKADPSPQNIERIKQDVQQLAVEREWTPDDVQGTIAGIDKVASAVKKIPQTLSQEKYDNALDIIMGKENLQEQLARTKELNATLDPALAEVGTPEERTLTAKLEQSDDKLREIVTNKKVKFSQDPETGEYFKQLGVDGKKEPITKDRFELEEAEQEARDIAENRDNIDELNGYIEQADQVYEQHAREAERETDPAEKAELEQVANQSKKLSDDAKKELQDQIDQSVLRFQERFPEQDVDVMEDMPSSVGKTFESVEGDKPIDVKDVNDASDYLYDKYKKLTAMKEANSRKLTIDQINKIQSQIEEDITLLENYKEKYFGDNAIPLRSVEVETPLLDTSSSKNTVTKESEIESVPKAKQESEIISEAKKVRDKSIEDLGSGKSREKATGAEVLKKYTVGEIGNVSQTETSKVVSISKGPHSTRIKFETGDVLEIPFDESSPVMDKVLFINNLHAINENKNVKALAEIQKTYQNTVKNASEEAFNSAKERLKLIDEINKKYTDTAKPKKPRYTIKGEKVTPKEEKVPQDVIPKPETNEVEQPVPVQKNVAAETVPQEGAKETVTPKSERQTTSDDFEKLVNKNIQSEEVSNTLNNIERETGRTLDAKEKEYQRTKRLEAIQHGADVVEKAKEEFGDDYANKLIKYLDENKGVSVENRSLITISLELDLERRILNEPENALTLNKQLKLVRDISTRQQRSAAIATGYGILRQLARVGYDVSQVTNEFFSSAERQSKKDLQKAIESDADSINKEAENIEKDSADTITPDIEVAIQKGVEAELKNIYDKLPSKRRQQADKAIEALTKIQKKLRSRTYDASIGVPVAIIDAGITTIKGAIRAGVSVADAIELGISKIKEAYGKNWAKEDAFRKDMLDGFREENVDVNTGSKRATKEREPKTNAERLADAKERIRARIADIKQEIVDKKRQMKAQGKPLEIDAEMASLQAEERAISELRDKYLPKQADPFTDAKKMAAITKKLMTDIEDINRQINQGEKDARADNKDPYDSVEINKLKAEKKARLELLENIDPTPKEFIKQALIDKGYGREITVTKNEVDANGKEVMDADGIPNKVKEKVAIVDWKKLAGEEGSVENIQKNVEEALRDKGYSESDILRMQDAFVKEYNALRASVIEKSLNELNQRNTPKAPAETKTSARRLAELYNYGLFDKESDTYDYLMNNALGLNDIGQSAFFKAKTLANALSDLYMTNVDGRKVSELGLKHAIRNLNFQIEALLSEVAWNQSNGIFKAATMVKEYMGMAQRGMLQSVKQFIENPLSGAIQRTFTKIGFSFDKVDTKALNANRSEIARAIYEDAVRNGGLAYGDITTPFITRSRTEEWLNRQSTSKVYHTILSAALGKSYLEGADSMHKSALTEKYFTYNLIKVLTDRNNPNRMSKEEAIKYVSEQLTGTKFEQAQGTAEDIIKKANLQAGKAIIPDNKQSVTRLASDLVKDGLLQDKKLTIEEIEASYEAAYTAAGFDMGHEANNPISSMVSNASSAVETKIQKAIKEKKWNEAAAYTFTSIISRNVLNPFVGGGTNWIILTMQKSGVDFISPLADYAKKRDNKLDLTTEEGVRNIEKSLMVNLKSKNSNTRVMVGAMASLLTFAAVKSTNSDETLNKWLKKNEWARKYFNTVSPQMLVLMLSIKNKKMSDYFAQLLNIKVGAFDEGKKLVGGVKELSSGKESGINKGTGVMGDLIGSRLSTPIVPWRFTRDLQNIGRGLQGKKTLTFDYNTSGFFNGFYKGGLIDYLGLRPEGTQNRKLSPAEMDKIIDDAVKKMNEKNE